MGAAERHAHQLLDWQDVRKGRDVARSSGPVKNEHSKIGRVQDSTGPRRHALTDTGDGCLAEARSGASQIE